MTQDAFPPSIPGEATRRALAQASATDWPRVARSNRCRSPASPAQRHRRLVRNRCHPRSVGDRSTPHISAALTHPLPQADRRKSVSRPPSPSISRPEPNGRQSPDGDGCLRRVATPQLLWASGIRPAALGRYLNDHIQVMSASVLEPSLVEQVARDPSTAGYRDGRDSGGDPLIGIHWIPYSDQHPYSASVMQLDLSPIGMGSATTTEASKSSGSDTSYQRKSPRTIAYVLRLGDRRLRNAQDADRVPADERRPKGDRGGQNTAGPGGGSARRVRSRPGTQPLPNGSSLHYQGTARMGERDNGTSVCDPWCRVWGIANLYVGGNGVIPTPTAGNITLSSVAHAIRAATAITDELALAPSPGCPLHR